MPGLYNKYIKLIHSLGDLAAVTISTVAAAILVHGEISSSSTPISGIFLLYFSMAWIACTLLLKTYRFYRVARIASLLIDALKAVLLYVLLLEATFNIVTFFSFTRAFLLYHYLLLSALVLAWRVAVTYSLRYFRRKGYNLKWVIIVGNANTGHELKNFSLTTLNMVIDSWVFLMITPRETLRC